MEQPQGVLLFYNQTNAAIDSTGSKSLGGFPCWKGL